MTLFSNFKKLSVVVVYVYVPREYLNVMRFEFHNQIFWLLFPRLLRDMLKTISVTFLYEHFNLGIPIENSDYRSVSQYIKNMQTDINFCQLIFPILIYDSRLVANIRYHKSSNSC